MLAEYLRVRTTVRTAEVRGPGGAFWTYTVVVADAPELLTTVANRESAELRWVAEGDVADLPLHPGFAASWRRLRVAATVPPHECDTDLPHTVVAESTFGWCTG